MSYFVFLGVLLVFRLSGKKKNKKIQRNRRLESRNKEVHAIYHPENISPI
jgi:hypothetical protein